MSSKSSPDYGKRTYLINYSALRSRSREIQTGLERGNIYIVARNNHLIGVLFPFQEVIHQFKEYVPRLVALGFEPMTQDFLKRKDTLFALCLEELKNPSLKKRGKFYKNTYDEPTGSKEEGRKTGGR